MQVDGISKENTKPFALISDLVLRTYWSSLPNVCWHLCRYLPVQQQRYIPVAGDNIIPDKMKKVYGTND